MRAREDGQRRGVTVKTTWFILLVIACGLIVSCGEFDEGIQAKSLALTDGERGDHTHPAVPRTSVVGRAFRFDWTWAYLEGAKVSVVERPDLGRVGTDASGFVQVDGLHVGQEATFVAEHPDFWPTQTATIIPDESGVDDLTFQMPPRLIVQAMAVWLLTWLNPERCQIATTVTVAGGTPFSPGLAGAQVSITPPLPEESGPFYFEIVEIPGWPMLDLPMRGLTETTGDGGAIFINVPPGDYVLSASREDEEFSTAQVKCRAGVLVNAAPPYGLHPIE
jgi:hypothetical protein